MDILNDVFIGFMENADVEDGRAVQRANKRMLAYLDKVSSIDKMNVEDMLTKVGYEYEKQGFLNGFQYALHLQNGGDLV